MLIDIVAAVSAGVGIAGVILLIRRLSRGRLPAWFIPAGIGMGILSYSVWAEYTWFPRVTGVLPSDVVLLAAPEDRSAIRPWTYIFPVSTRFMALDRTSLKTSEANPSIRLADVMLVERWMTTKRIPIGFDCAAGQRVDLVDGTTLAPDGTLTGGIWVPAGQGDAMQAAACAEG